MGCASSTPLMNGSAGGIVEAAKHAAGDVAHAGEEAMHDVTDSLNGTVGHAKDAVVGAVHGIGQGLDGVLHTASDGIKTLSTSLTSGSLTTGTTESGTEYTHIPLKDPAAGATMLAAAAAGNDEHLAEFKETLLKKVQSFDANEAVDELMKETADAEGSAAAAAAAAAAAGAALTESMSVSQTATVDVDDADDKDGVVDINDKKAVEDILIITHDDDDDADDDVNAMMADDDANKTPTHSLDSLRTSSPDPEIEKALANVDEHQRNKAPSPEPTINELGELEKAAMTIAAGGDAAQQ